ncbi:hypothetical protein ABEG18_06955 [Alsobacter sp. KACC 23698]|uniref:Uncharacterized protein n=1 Tax=Alsobacter sp. KACC 23698 TaxID=3149229 RepID=A0AAU7JJE7_9HYPH
MDAQSESPLRLVTVPGREGQLFDAFRSELVSAGIAASDEEWASMSLVERGEWLTTQILVLRAKVEHELEEAALANEQTWDGVH